jgi:uncharacterized protein
MFEPITDLRWLLASPPLLNPAHPQFVDRMVVFDATERAAIDEWLGSVAQDAAPLHSFLEPFLAENGPPRLGRYAERLLEFYLRFGPLHRFIASNLPIRRGANDRTQIDHTTIGEIDFLVETPRGEAEHWELAVKYFLCAADGPIATSDDFVGPDRAEVMTGKLAKLFDRQLGNTPPAPYADRTWRPRAFTRGWMFYAGDPPRCDLLAASHLRGRWVGRSDASALPEGRYVLVPRTAWMGAPDDARIQSRDALLADIDLQWSQFAPATAKRWPQARMIARLVETPGMLREAERLFVVPDDWSTRRV